MGGNMFRWIQNFTLYRICIGFMLLLDISAIFLNGIIAHVLKKDKKTNVILHWLVYCLCISDVLVGVSGLATHITQLYLLAGLTESGRFIHLWLAVCWGFLGFYQSFSGRLILIIAVDRCLHMKYLNKYNTIMTTSRARFAILFNTILGILFSASYLAPSESVKARFEFGVTIFNITGCIVTGVVYVFAYLLIKRRVGGLNSIYTLKMVSQSAPVGEIFHERRTPPKIGKGEHSGTECHIPRSDVLSKDLLPMHPMKCVSSDANKRPYIDLPTSHAEICEIGNDDRTIAIEHAPKSATDAGTESTKRNLSPKVKQRLNCKRKILRPELEFWKATCLILSSLAICYTPQLSYEVYCRILGDCNFEVTTLLAVSVLLNSSLNALVLILCSNELKQNIKKALSLSP